MTNNYSRVGDARERRREKEEKERKLENHRSQKDAETSWHKGKVIILI